MGYAWSSSCNFSHTSRLTSNSNQIWDTENVVDQNSNNASLLCLHAVIWIPYYNTEEHPQKNILMKPERTVKCLPK